MRKIAVRALMPVAGLKRYIEHSIMRVRYKQSSLTLNLEFEEPVLNEVLDWLEESGCSIEMSKHTHGYKLHIYWRLNE